ncbi:15787_t:CDS:2, partial [Acaulospora morrowiae]
MISLTSKYFAQRINLLIFSRGTQLKIIDPVFFRRYHSNRTDDLSRNDADKNHEDTHFVKNGKPVLIRDPYNRKRFEKYALSKKKDPVYRSLRNKRFIDSYIKVDFNLLE